MMLWKEPRRKTSSPKSMTADGLFSKILENNYTKSSALAALANYANDVNKALFKSKDAQEFEGLKREDAKKIIDETKVKIEKSEPLFITLATQLPDDKIADLGAKIRKMYGREFLFELSVNTALLSGAQLVYKGRMLDFSLKNKIDASCPQILEICKKYLS